MTPRRRGRRIALSALAVVVVVAAGVVCYLGAIGMETTLRAGTQATVCGVEVGVLSADERVRLGWNGGGASLAVGERARIAPWCVVEVTAIGDRAADDEQDGGGPDVSVRWSLW